MISYAHELHLLVLCHMPYTGTLSKGEDNIPNIISIDGVLVGHRLVGS
jgi:hypothetical protein